MNVNAETFTRCQFVVRNEWNHVVTHSILWARSQKSDKTWEFIASHGTANCNVSLLFWNILKFWNENTLWTTWAGTYYIFTLSLSFHFRCRNIWPMWITWIAAQFESVSVHIWMNQKSTSNMLAMHSARSYGMENISTKNGSNLIRIFVCLSLQCVSRFVSPHGHERKNRKHRQGIEWQSCGVVRIDFNVGTSVGRTTLWDIIAWCVRRWITRTQHNDCGHIGNGIFAHALSMCGFAYMDLSNESTEIRW